MKRSKVTGKHDEGRGGVGEVGRCHPADTPRQGSHRTKKSDGPRNHGTPPPAGPPGGKVWGEERGGGGCLSAGGEGGVGGGEGAEVWVLGRRGRGEGEGWWLREPRRGGRLLRGEREPEGLHPCLVKASSLKRQRDWGKGSTSRQRRTGRSEKNER